MSEPKGVNGKNMWDKKQLVTNLFINEMINNRKWFEIDFND